MRPAFLIRNESMIEKKGETEASLFFSVINERIYLMMPQAIRFPPPPRTAGVSE